MLEALALRFHIVPSGGRPLELSVDAEVARVGSGSHCEIKLEPEQAAVEHLLVRAGPGGVFAEARSLEPPVTLNGAPFLQGRLLPDSVLRLGSTELSVAVVERAAGGLARTGRNRPATSGVAAAGMLLVALAGLFLVLRRPAPPAALPAAPPLWPSASPAVCPQSEPGAARALAERLERQAAAGRERAPFDPAEGVAAADALARAVACFTAAGEREAAERGARDLATLRADLARDFHVHGVRLERALATKRYEQARTEVRLLLAYGAGRGEPYFGWLAELDRRIELEFAGKKRT